jgi:hypothetical protein
MKHWTRAILPAALLTILLTAAICGQAAAQYYDGFDQQSWGYAHTPNALRIYFDETVELFNGPIPEIEMWWANSLTATPTAWLVMVSPSATTMSGWQCRFQATGQGTAGPLVLLGDGAVNAGTGDDFMVTYPVPRPMSGLHVPLLQCPLTLDAATMPPFPYGVMAFTIAPLSTGAPLLPGYHDGQGTFIPSTSLTSPWHGWGVPCMLLNSNDGVVQAEPSTWGGVKALYR